MNPQIIYSNKYEHVIRDVLLKAVGTILITLGLTG